MRRSLILAAGAALALQLLGVSYASDHHDAISPKGLAEDEIAKIAGKVEKFDFQADVNRVTDILINSLYQSRDTFLRELISNSADALDKVRFLSVSDNHILDTKKELEVRISFNKEDKTIIIRDSGIGMTKADLIANLGTIAKSGTTAFIEAMSANGGDLSQIGQFGVGFYSAFLVSDRVRVVSKHNDDTQHIWESAAEGSFSIVEDPRGDTLGRGTEITLFLKEDAGEYLDDTKLENIVNEHSQFINFPIYLYTSHDEKVPKADADAQDSSKDDEDDGSTDNEDEEDEEEEDAETKADETDKKDGEATETKTVFEWKHLNTNKAIWTRPKEDITDDEYRKFYKALNKEVEDPLAWTHFKAEGETEFRSILFIPKRAPFDYYDKYYQKPTSLKLYVRKVLITDKLEDLIPRYLSFLRGVVDSDDLPLNVSRETLQQHKVLKVMGKKIVRKALELLRKLAEESQKEKQDADEDEEEKNSDDEDDYTQFWKAFGKSIKMGVIEDSTNRQKLAKLLRYISNKSDGKFISLDDYINRMKDWQNTIYFISGESIDAIKNSPFLEKLKRKDVEYLYLTDPLDEYAVQNLMEYSGKKLQSVTKEGVKFGDEDDKLVEKRQKIYKEDYKPLTEYLKKSLAEKIEKVVISQRITDSPAVLVTGQFGYTAHMEKIIKAQAFADPERRSYMMAKKTLEINPRHPIVYQLNQLVKDSPDADETKDAAWVLFDTALVNSGFDIEDSDNFGTRMYRLLKAHLKLDSLELRDEVDVPEDPEEEEESKDENSDLNLDIDEDKTKDEL